MQGSMHASGDSDPGKRSRYPKIKFVYAIVDGRGLKFERSTDHLRAYSL